MLVPVQVSGAKPPIYFIHGLSGVMPLGRFLTRSLGPDQPFYAINATGIDGRGTMPSSVKDMTLTYVKEISDAQPRGPLLIAGMCAGGLAAMEVASELLARGREVGPVILVDPPTPGRHILLNPTVDPNNPLVAAQLYERARGSLLRSASDVHYDMPFAVNDQQQLHFAALAAVNSLVVFCRHVPEVFPGAAVAILSSQRATAFFHPQMTWIKLLPRLMMAHVLPFDHNGLFHSGLQDLARIFKFVLEGATDAKIPAELPNGRMFAPA
jgi:pimeloyl-ACP methyl ester carboxylesterase